jgi:hypothetical protein
MKEKEKPKGDKNGKQQQKKKMTPAEEEEERNCNPSRYLLKDVK